MTKTGTPIAFLRIGVGLTLVSSAAFAQQEIIDRCKETSSKGDRIACLEAALLSREYREREALSQTQVQPQGPKPEAGQLNAAAEPEPAPEISPDEPAAAPKVAGIGAEQVITRQQTSPDRRAQLDEERGLAIASYSYVPYRRLVVTLENGQVWRQIKGDNQYFRINLKRNQTADITESPLGGYTLRLNEVRRTIRVQRVE